MNWHFAREVGLPKFFWRRGMIALRRALSSKPIRFRLPTGRQLICPLWSPSAQDAFVTAADVDWGSEALFFRPLARDGDFPDVGANIGYCSMYGAPVVRRAFSFEPDPRNHSALEEKARLAGNIVIKRVALSSHDGIVQLELGEESSVSKVVEGANDGSGRKLEVPSLTLDSFALSRPDLPVVGITLDTEGHELPILRVGVATIRRAQPLILAELMRRPCGGDDAFHDLAEFAGSLRYRPFAFVPQSPGFLCPGGSPLTARKLPWQDPHIRFFCPSLFRKLARDHGFEQIQIIGSGFDLGGLSYVYHTNWLRSVLAAIGLPFRWLGRVWSSLFASRIFLAAKNLPAKAAT